MTKSSPSHSTRGDLVMNTRQKLLWVLFFTGCMALFLAWNNQQTIDGTVSSVGMLHKGFQVNPKQPLKNPIRQISLIGERNSGTKWLWAHLHECYNHAIPVEKKFTRYKHWFQSPEYERYPRDTLVIAEFRNPYEWLLAMMAMPHHMPAHAGLDWKTFLTKPWTTKRVGLDLKLKGDEMCQHHFRYKDLISCIHRPEPDRPLDNRVSLDKPFYEMRNDGSGLPYDNIMEMRSDKIRNIMEIKDFPNVADLWNVQYEYLLSHGTQQLIDRIQEWTGVEPQCKGYAPQNRAQRNITGDFAEYVTAHLNWTVEEWIGYEPLHSALK